MKTWQQFLEFKSTNPPTKKTKEDVCPTCLDNPCICREVEMGKHPSCPGWSRDNWKNAKPKRK